MPSILDTLAAISRISNDPSLGLEKRLSLLLSEIVRGLGTERASIMLVRGGRNLEVVASTVSGLAGVRVSLSLDTPATWVYRNGKPLYVDESTDNPAAGTNPSRYRKSAFFCAPLVFQGKTLGVLSVTERLGEDRLTEVERELLLQIASHFISAIEVSRLSDLLKKRRADLREKNKRLRELEKIKNELFNMLIHDLKGPITELFSVHEILAETLTGDDKEALEAGSAALTGLFQMVTNLLDVVRMEEGRLPLSLEATDAAQALGRAEGRLSVLLGLKGIRLLKERSAKRPPLILADTELLVRIFQNLLTNAIEHSEIGGAIEAGFFEEPEGRLTMVVRDYGPGVPEEYREKIFDKFARVERGAATRGYSTGLGLAFCRLAVQAQGGSISVSDANPGARFTFALPLADRQ